MTLIIFVLHNLIQIYLFIVLIACVLSFLPLNMNNNFIRKVVEVIRNMTEPVFAMVRKYIPTNVGMFDFSPIVVLFGLQLLDILILNLARYI